MLKNQARVDAYDSLAQVNLSPNSLLRSLLKIVAVVVLSHVVVHLASAAFDIASTPLAGFFRFFDMGAEANFPTYISALSLLFASLLCLLIARQDSLISRSRRRGWMGLAIGLFLMSFDEAAMIHDGVVGVFLEQAFGTGEGVFRYTWYIPYIPLMFVLALVYIPFFRRLPARYSSLFVLSGVVYFGGALGLEMLESYGTSAGGFFLYGRNMTGLLRLCEESLEMLGIVILIYSLARYLADAGHVLEVRFPVD